MFAIIGQRSSDPAHMGRHTETISFPPSTVHAQVALTALSGSLDTPYDSRAVILGFTHRPTPDGADVAVESPLWNMAIVGIVERMTSVTWMSTGATNLYLQARVDIFFWGQVAEKTRAPTLGPLRLARGSAVALFDAKTGTVHHVHEEIALPGARVPEKAALERRAFTLARSLPDAVPNAKALHLRGDEIHRLRGFRVDPNTQKIIELPRPLAPHP